MSNTYAPGPSLRPVTGYQIERSLQAWRDLRSAFDIDPTLAEDEDAQGRFLHASGAEPPHTLLASLIDDVIAIERRAAQMEALKKRYQQRQLRFEARAEKVRATITQLFEVLEVSAWEGSEGTAGMRKGRASVIITDLDKLPAEFKTVETITTPHKVPIGAKLNAGEVVEGAELSNPPLGLAITPY